jgi:hypothetical protein
MGLRYTRYGKRLLLKFEESAARVVPVQWTDQMCPDVEVTLGEGRALFCLADLMALADLVDRLCGKETKKASHGS